MNNIRLIVTDMDGTLLDDKQQLTDETIQVFKQALQQGIGVVLASGRNLSGLLSYGEQLSLSSSPLSGYITLNGLELYNSKFQCIKKYQRLGCSFLLSDIIKI